MNTSPLSRNLRAISCAALALAMSIGASETELDVPANFEIQAKKVLYNSVLDQDGHNLDQWWGRVNVSVISKSDKHEGKVTIRAYPPEFGYDPVLAYSPDRDTTVYRLVNGQPTAVDTSVKGEPISSQIDKFQVYEAYLVNRGAVVTTKVGRYIVDDKNGFYFGNYTDNLPGGSFYSLGPTVNALELSAEFYKVMHMAVQLESADDNLNRGNLRAFFHFHNLPAIERLEVGFGYRGNIFDQARYSNADIYHNVSLAFNLPITERFRLFMETAAQGLDREDAEGKSMDIRTPVTAGFEIPAGRAFKKAIFELEWDKDREEFTDSDGKRRQKEVLGSVMLQKEVGERFLFTFGAFSHENTADWAVLLRMQATIN